MPYIEMPDAPGIMGPMMFRPQTAKPLFDLAEVLLRGESPLSRGDREVIAAYVSTLNQCQFCANSHATFAALQLDGKMVDRPVLLRAERLLARAARVASS